ncbi:RNA polymerase II subunit A C-terminal domain phosphatase [Martiniozyma asiatica (nom. inval.)]|nr:RNA polymerase II subunit A C-terminal domain phosphatase [Martiniozyma asiatica]
MSEIAENQPALRFCTVCASNNNRSMEAHKVLANAGYLVRSYGTGSAVRLPGVSIDKPNVFPFTTPYTKVMDTLQRQIKETGDSNLHKKTGVLAMTERNMKIKRCPERWPYFDQPPQRMPEEDHPGFEGELDFEIVICCEERCFDAVVEDFLKRNYYEDGFRKVHVFNVDIRDDHDNAQIGGRAILKLANGLEKLYEETEDGSWEDKMLLFFAEWQNEFPNLPLLYSLCYY